MSGESVTSAALDHLDALATAATPGPWEVYETRGGTYVTRPDLLGVAREWSLVWQPADAAFIAESRTAVPNLVAALRAVLALHTPCNDSLRSGCRAGDGAYPCATVAAITEHLGAEGADRG